MRQKNLYDLLLFYMRSDDAGDNEKEASKLLERCIRDEKLGEFFIKNLNPNYYINVLLHKAIAETENILDFTKNFTVNLAACNQTDIELVNWALWFTDNMTSSKIRNNWRNFIDLEHTMLKSNYPDVTGDLTARIKSWISAWTKEVRCHNWYKMNDIYGIRFVLRTNHKQSEQDLVNTLYNIVLDTIRLATSIGLTMISAEPKKDVNCFHFEKHPDLVIPKQSTIDILREYAPCIKDYIAHPKEDGYQSIHIVFEHPLYGKIELQFRTKKMDDYAENGPASHKKYKALNPLYNFYMDLAKKANNNTDHMNFIGLTQAEKIHQRYLRYSPVTLSCFPKEISELDLSQADLSVLKSSEVFY